MSEAFIGEIRVFPYTYAPQDWLECNGQMVAVQQYQALYAVIGHTYGGSGNSTFALPNLAGCAPVGMGQAPGLSAYTLGQPPAGAAAVTLTPAELPSHWHTLTAKYSPDTSPGQVSYLANPAGADLTLAFTRPNATTIYAPFPGYSNNTPNVTLASQSLSQAGTVNVQPHENRQPFLAFRFCICTSGVYPTRD
jgi:microcystin-dependent protein